MNLAVCGIWYAIVSCPLRISIQLIYAAVELSGIHILLKLQLEWIDYTGWPKNNGTAYFR